MFRFLTPGVMMVVLLFWLLPAAAPAQDTSARENLVEIVLKDGSKLIGRVVEENDQVIRFQTTGGVEMTIPRDQIQVRRPVRGKSVRGEFWPEDPNTTRLLFSPTARPLKAGQGYFSLYEVFFPMVAVGLTDFMSVATGVSLFPGVSNQIIYLNGKLTPINRDNFALAGGALYVFTPGTEGAGILYSVITAGSDRAAFTGGLGWGYTGEDIANEPILMLGGEIRLSRRIKLLSENWIIPNSDVVPLSWGVRFLGERLSADIAFIFPAGAEIEGWPFLPWFGFVYNFGHK